jgi:hypothetical protein
MFGIQLLMQESKKAFFFLKKKKKKKLQATLAFGFYDGISVRAHLVLYIRGLYALNISFSLISKSFLFD